MHGGRATNASCVPANMAVEKNERAPTVARTGTRPKESSQCRTGGRYGPRRLDSMWCQRSPRDWEEADGGVTAGPPLPLPREWPRGLRIQRSSAGENGLRCKIRSEVSADASTRNKHSIPKDSEIRGGDGASGSIQVVQAKAGTSPADTYDRKWASGESSQLCRGARSPEISLQSSGRRNPGGSVPRVRGPSRRRQGGVADCLSGQARGARQGPQPKEDPGQDDKGYRGRQQVNLAKQDSDGREWKAGHDQRTIGERPSKKLLSQKADQGKSEWSVCAKALRVSHQEGSSQWHKGPSHLAQLAGYVASAVSGLATAVQTCFLVRSARPDECDLVAKSPHLDGLNPRGNQAGLSSWRGMKGICRASRVPCATRGAQIAARRRCSNRGRPTFGGSSSSP